MSEHPIGTCPTCGKDVPLGMWCDLCGPPRTSTTRMFQSLPVHTVKTEEKQQSMPNEFLCRACGEEFEMVARDEHERSVCPHCGEKAYLRIYNAIIPKIEAWLESWESRR